MIEEEVMLDYTIRAIALFFNLALVLLFIYLRVKGNKEPLTLSQRWALSILIWLFLINSLTIVNEYIRTEIVFLEDWEGLFHITRVNSDFDILVGIMLLSFGLVYPRPYTRWDRLFILLMGILLLTLVMMVIQIMGHSSTDQSVYDMCKMSGYTYAIGWFLPVVIWLPYYEKETSPHSRMVLTLFIWGFISAPITQNITSFFSVYTDDPKQFSAFTLLSMTLFIYIMARICRELWIRKGNWGMAERIHGFFLAFFMFAAIVRVLFGIDGNVLTAFLYYLAHNASWTILRPTLFTYAILRYQIFGPQLRIEKPISLIMGTMASMSMVVLVLIVPTGIDPMVLMGSGALLGIILFVPFWRLSKRVVNRFLPMTSGEERATMVEKRSTYLVSLQTAVVKGVVDTEEDRKNLAQQRRMLGISQREHDLLMDSFAGREERTMLKEEVEELFLVHIDGRLLVHTSRTIVKGGKDSEVVAGMLVAIRDYVQEGLRMGKGASLDTIKYGDYSLNIETGEFLVLAAVVKGQVSPELRQDLRDQLRLLESRHDKDLRKWDGDHDRAKGAKDILKGFMEELALM